MVERLLIGDVARRSGLSRKALRLYESRGILPRPQRAASGYRVYHAEVLGLLTFVAQARRLGLTLGEIAEIVAQRRSGGAPCSHVRSLLEQKAADLTAMLEAVRSILDAWKSTSSRGGVVCPHIEGRGGEIAWKGASFLSVRRARTAPRSSSKGRKSGSGRTPIRQSSKRTNGTSSLT